MGEKKLVFARTATGIVREMSPLGAFAYNMLTAFILTPFYFLLALFAFPKGDIVTGSLIAIVLSFFSTTTYAMLATSFPRSGAEYIIQSRITRSGAMAFPMIFNAWILWQAIVVVVLWIVLVSLQVALAPFLIVFGASSGFASLAGLGYWILTPLGATITCILLVILVYAVNIAGFKWFVRINWILWGFYLVGAILIAAIFLTGSHSAFVTNFNAMMSSLGMEIPQSFGGDAYQYIISTAGESIDISPSYSAFDTFGTAAVMASTCHIWAVMTIGILGEVKGAGSLKRNMLTMPLAMIVAGLLATTMVFGYIQTTGREFVIASAWGFYSYVISFPVPPFFGFIAFLMTENVVARFLLMLGIFFGALFISFQIVQYATRALFAMSLDRVLPSFICDINRQTRTPIKAHIVLLIPTLIYAPIFCFIPAVGLFTLGTLVTGLICIAFTCLCGAIFPFTARDTYRASPISRYNVGGIPLISIVGTIGFLWVLSTAAIVTLKPELGVIAPYPVEALGSIFGTFIICLIAFFLIRWYRSRQGINIDFAYKEIPPE